MKRIALISLVAVAFVACKDGPLPTGTGPIDTGLETVNFSMDMDNGQAAKFLIIDEESIGKDAEPNFFSGDDVNEPMADIGLRVQLPFFAANVGAEITLHTGEVGDEGWFALKAIPPSWGESDDAGLSNYLAAGPGLGTEDANGDREALLDKIPDVTPLRATGLIFLTGLPVCAVVYKSDVSINYDPLDGSLKGDNLGIVAFEVLAVTKLEGSSSSSLPKVDIEILNAEVVCNGTLTHIIEDPDPIISSSEPFDVDPADGLCEEGFFGGDPEDPDFVCAAASLPAGESLDLVVDDEILASAEVDETSLIAMLECPDLRDRAARPTIGDGLVDLPTFGTCIEIISLDLLPASGIASVCNPFTDAEADALGPVRIARMTVHRFGSEDASAVALPHSAGPECPEVVALELNGLERFVRFARNTWRAVSDQVRAWIEPAPLWAKMAFRCNRGGCSSSTGFRSSFEVVQPSSMDHDPTAGPSGDGVFGDILVGTPLTVKVNAFDSGELVSPPAASPSGTPDPVEGVRLTFTATAGGSFSAPAACVGGTTCTVETDGSGNAEVTQTIVLGANTVVVTGIGVATDASVGTVLGVFGPSINDEFAAEVPLAEGTLTFSATGVQPDLIVFDLSHSPAEPLVGEDVTIAATVKNIGTAPTLVETLVSIAVDGEATPPTFTVPVLAIGATFVAERVGDFALGDHNVTAEADVTGLVDESDEDNNDDETDAFTVVQPDLIVFDLALSPTSPTNVDVITFTATVKNVGTAVAPASTLEFLVAGEVTGAAGTLFAVPAIAAGSDFDVLRDTILPPGNYGNSAAADFVGNAVDESDETNNTRAEAYTVVAAPILIYGPSMNPIGSPRTKNEETFAGELGLSVVVADAALWGSFTTADFEGFSAIIFGDLFQFPGDLSSLVAAEANKPTWSAAVTGPMVVGATNPQTHAHNRLEAPTLVKNLISFAANGAGTGLYASLSRYYAGAATMTPVSFLTGIGDFRVVGIGGSAFDVVTIVEPGHPVMAGLTNAGLSGWFASVHAFIQGQPAPFITLAEAGIVGVGVGVLPVIIATPEN